MFDALFTTTTEYKKLSHALSGKGACALFGLPASGRAQVYAALCRQLDKPLCIVTLRSSSLLQRAITLSCRTHLTRV